MATTRWQKAYQGPFSKAEALALVADLRKTAKPDVNGIYDARIRARKGGKGYDVYIKAVR